MTGVIRRANAVKSGRIEYRFESGTVGSGGQPPSRTPARVLSFEGSDWIERDRGGASVLIHYGDYVLQFDEVAQRKRRVLRTVTISRLASSRVEGPQNRRPTFAGSFWHAQQLEYVERHRAKFRPAPPKSIGEVPCEVCEVDVPAKDVGAAFHFNSPALNAGGTLRLHIAPQLGFALPLIEARSTDGRSVVSYESRDFVEFPDNLHFPRRIRMEFVTPNSVAAYDEFTIAPEQINEPIADSEFILELPAGTRVQDERDPEHPRRIVLQSASTSAQLAGPDHHRSGTAEESGRSTRAWLLAIGSLIVVAIICLMMVRPRWRKRGSK